MSELETYSFGEWLKQQRERLRLTQRELAAMTYCSVPMIKKIEADERHPSPELAELLAVALKIPESEQGIFIEVARGEHPVDFLWQVQDKTTPTSSAFQGTISLPNSATPFVGREDDLAEIANLLAAPACHLLTLVGPGGIGKTRLAIEAAQQSPGIFRDGVCFASLQPITSTEFIIPTLVNSFKLSFYGESDPKTQLLGYLREKQLLLVIDNFEHLLDGATLLPEILEYAPEVKMLVTSRERLHLQEEWVFNVSGLNYPTDERAATSDSYSAVQLFVQHTRRAGYTVTDADSASIVRICQLVEGMPLGIELAASWTRALSCEAIAGEIARNLDILETPARNVPPRHRTMRAVFEPTWAQLSQDEQAVFMKLSIFHGGFTRESAGYVAGASLRTLPALVDKSLLRMMANDRYDIHELLRQYAREKVNASGEVAAVLARHRDYFLEFAEKAEQELYGVNQVDWYDLVEIEIGNLRAAVDWSLENGDVIAALRLMSGPYRFWVERGYHREGYERLRTLHSQPQAQARTSIRAKALSAAGHFLWFERDYEGALLLLQEAQSIAHEVGDAPEFALAMRRAGTVFYGLGDYQAARASLEESLIIARELQDPYGIAWSLVHLSDVMLQLGERERVKPLCQEAVDILNSIGEIALRAMAFRRLGLVALGDNDTERAKALCRQSLNLNIAVRDRRAVAACLVALAGIDIVEGRTLHAVKQLGAVETLLNDVMAHLLLPDQQEYEHHMSYLRAHVDSPTFESAWAKGKSMTMEQAVAAALEDG